MDEIKLESGIEGDDGDNVEGEDISFEFESDEGLKGGKKR